MAASIPLLENAWVRRVFGASPGEVFEAWTKKDIVEQWWGPPGFSTRVRELDLRVGGQFHFEMQSSTGSKGATAGMYHVIDPPVRLQFTMTEHCNCDLESGQRAQLMPCLVEVTFQAIDNDRTQLIIHHQGLNDSATVDRVSTGWSGSLSRLNELFA